jgi:hypothetical protein
MLVLGPKSLFVQDSAWATRKRSSLAVRCAYEPCGARQRQKAIMPGRMVPTSRGGIGVEAGTCSLGKSEAGVSNSVCIVAGDVVVCVHHKKP